MKAKKHPYVKRINKKFKGTNSCAIVGVVGEGTKGIYTTLFHSSNPYLPIKEQLKQNFKEDGKIYNYNALMIYPKINLEAENKISLIVGKLNLGRKIRKAELANLLA